jgi:hypothetical protein
MSGRAAVPPTGPQIRSMMPAPLQLTPFADVNEVLRELLAQVQTVLGSHFVGMYLSGSLALGDFNPHRSDIDLVIVTDAPVSGELFAALLAMHACIAADGSPWVAKIDAVYVPALALHSDSPPGARYPVLESGRTLALDRLEDGWSVQCFTVREHGLAVAGPEPRSLVGPVDPDHIRRAGAVIAGTWLDEARADPSWLEWLRRRENQAFVVLTLCRLLYTLETGAVASKPGAARWAQQAAGPHWAGLIERSLAGQSDGSEIPESEVDETMVFVRHTVDRFQAWEASACG